MCTSCWAEYGSPTIDSDEIRKAALLICQLHESEIVGGMLHVQLDDFNIDGSLFENPFDDFLLELHGREPLDVEVEIAEVMNALSDEERASALALANGYWSTSDDFQPVMTSYPVYHD